MVSVVMSHDIREQLDLPAAIAAAEAGLATEPAAEGDEPR